MVPSQPHPASSEKELDREINSAHNDVCSWLSSRLSLLKDVRAEWSVYEPKASLEVAINSGSQPVIVDLLSVLNLKRSLWTLDMAILVLPEDMHLLKSRHQNYIMCAITNLKLLLKSFSSVIIANIRHPSTPTNAGIDIAKEERIEKCEMCYAHLCKIRNEIISSPPSSLLSRMAKEHNLLDTFNLLK
jgi:katanin p80 WD40 repeat-containing subunit B1